MGSVLQFTTFFCICCLIRGVVTHPNQNEDKRMNYKRSNPNSPEVGDFYFVEEKANDDKVKTGRAIPRSAWSKEDKEPVQPVENKTGSQPSEEFSIKKFLSYLLNVVHELKEDIFGIKEIASLKKTKDLPNSQDNFEDKGKQNKMEENHDVPKPVGLTENTEFRNENQQPTSNYITDYYQKNGIKFTDDEENEDDLEISSDVSDDSSHKPNEEDNMPEVSKNNDNTHNFKCLKIKRKPDKYSFEAKKTTAIPTSQTKIPNEGFKEFSNSKERGKDDDFKESTTKPTKTEQNHSKASRKETENGTASPPSSKTGKCVKKNNKDCINNLNEKNGPTEKLLKYSEYVTAVSPQNESSDQEESKRSNQDKTVVHRSSGKNTKNKDGSDFDNKPGALIQSTTLPSQSSKDVTFPEDEHEPYASGTTSENPIYRKEQEQITSQPEDKKRTQNNVNSLTDTDGINEHTTVSYQSDKPAREIPKHKITTEAYTIDTEINDSPKESKGKRSKVISTQTIVTYNENEQNSKTDTQQTSNSFDIGNTIATTTSGNIMNTDNLNKDSSDNFDDKKGTNEKGESEKLSAIKQDKNDSETQGDNETVVQEVNDDSEPENSLKNKKLNNSNPVNNNKEEDDNLTSATTNELPFQDSDSEIQNHNIKRSDKPQAQENNENLNKRAGMQDISPDQEYEYEEDSEDFDISDELNDSEDFNQNQEDELNTNTGDHEDDEEIDQGNTGTVLTNESQVSQRYVMGENSQEQYDTFLEYFYKHSNNPYFQSLQDQSNNFSDGKDEH